jgi:low density lipoprotein-related protein 2
MTRNDSGTRWARTATFVVAFATAACVNGAGMEQGGGGIEQPRPPKECRAGDWTCSDGTCIDGERQCDGSPDCAQGEDEGHGHGPGGVGCYDGTWGFVCGADDWYIVRELVCNGARDCDNGADELGCPVPGSSRPPEDCRDGDWICNDGRCIDGTRLCDRSRDCINGEDEGIGYGPGGQGCFDATGAFYCGGADDRYGLAQIVCDGRVDCKYGADELGCDQGDPADEAGICLGNFECGDGSCGADGLCYCERCDGRPVAECEGTCTALDTDDNCGQCGYTCPQGTACVAGGCFH